MTKDTVSSKIETLLSVLKSSDLEKRQEAIYNLHKLSEDKNEGMEATIPTIKDAINDPDWVIRKFSIMILGELDVREEIPKFIEILNSDSEPEVRVGAADALGRLKSEEAIKPLILALDNSYEMLKQVSIWSLVQIGKKSSSAVPKIIEHLLKPDIVGIAQTNNLAAWALGEIGDTSAIEPLIRALNEADYSERKFIIAYSLALLEGSKGVGYPTLLKMKNNRELRGHEIESLHELEEKFSKTS
ncbi:MAG: HEAT repeat domain-containing protein [Candidatus Hodarchaeales archaeon]